MQTIEIHPVRAAVCRGVLPFALGWLLTFNCLVPLPCGSSAVAGERAKALAGRAAAQGERGMVVSVSVEASEAGLAVLKEGGTAVDAAVTVALALAVTWPEAGNIGGGGFMMIAPATGEPVCLDYRETAPAATTADMFAAGTDYRGHRVVGVPGTVAGLAAAHARYGRLPWRRLVEPAIQLAAEGFSLTGALASDLNQLLAADGVRFAELRRVFGRADGRPWRQGDRLVQPDLAASLRLIAEEGPEAFYRGRIAEQIVAEMQAGDGLITLADLAAYEPKFREPVTGSFRGYTIYGPPPPSSGGLVVLQALGMLEHFKLGDLQPHSAESLHLIAEAMRRAYRDRALHLGDPDFVQIPAGLTDPDYLAELAAGIDPQRATPSAELAAPVELTPEGASTTHFSIVDADGLGVSNTYTIEQSYGSRVVVRGAGFLLNNEMTDFNLRPGTTNRQGRIGTPANTAAPGKRMLSSQCPTAVYRDGELMLLTGSPGGRTIPNTVLCILLNVLQWELDLPAATTAPRLHHQWFPDILHLERADTPELARTVTELRQRGHVLALPPRVQGDAHSILIRDGRYTGAADSRRHHGHAAGW